MNSNQKQPLPPEQYPASTTEPILILLFQNCHFKVVACTLNPDFLAYANERGSEQICSGIKRFDEIGFLGDNRCLQIFQNNFS